ncbi:hypothetical protein KI387_030136, partial [Taxus chinensis]
LDNNSHTDSPPNQTIVMTTSHDSHIFDTASPNPSHTLSYYIDDPIDSMVNDIFIFESLSNVNDTLDSHDSTTFHTVECDFPTPLSPEVASSVMHESPPSIISSSPTISYLPNALPTFVISSYSIE